MRDKTPRVKLPAAALARRAVAAPAYECRQVLDELVNALETNFRDVASAKHDSVKQLTNPLRIAVKLVLQSPFSEADAARYDRFCSHAHEFVALVSIQGVRAGLTRGLAPLSTTLERLRKKDSPQEVSQSMPAESTADREKDFVVYALTAMASWAKGELAPVEMQRVTITLDWILDTCRMESPWNARADNQVIELMSKLREAPWELQKDVKVRRLAARVKVLLQNFDSHDDVEPSEQSRLGKRAIDSPQRGKKRVDDFKETAEMEEDDDGSQRQVVKTEETVEESKNASGEPLGGAPRQNNLASMDSATETEDDAPISFMDSSTETEPEFHETENASTKPTNSQRFKAPAIELASQINKIPKSTRHIALAELVNSLETSFEDSSTETIKHVAQLISPVRTAVKLILQGKLNNYEVSRYDRFCLRAREFLRRVPKEAPRVALTRRLAPLSTALTRLDQKPVEHSLISDESIDYVRYSLATIASWPNGKVVPMQVQKITLTLTWILETCTADSVWDARADAQVGELVAKLQKCIPAIYKTDKKGKISRLVKELQKHFDNSSIAKSTSFKVSRRDGISSKQRYAKKMKTAH